MNNRSSWICVFAILCAGLMIGTSFICLAGDDTPTTSESDSVALNGEGYGACCTESDGTVEFWVDNIKLATKANGTAKVIGYDDDDKKCDIVVPDTAEYEGKTYVIDEIGEYAFTYGLDLRAIFARYPGSVEIGPNIVTIGAHAMDYASKHHHVNTFKIREIESSKLRSIGEYAFRHTNIQEIELPASLEQIGHNAFEECKSLEQCTIHSVHVHIWQGAFFQCSNLKSVSIEGSTALEANAFSMCTKLQSISAPAATLIGDYAFDGCKNLQSVDMPKVGKIGKKAFNDCKALVSLNTRSVTSIGDYAFKGCDNLQSVDISDVKNIGFAAFQNCKNLKAADMSSVVTVGDYAFDNCCELKSASMPYATTIGKYAFRNCVSMSELYMRSVVTVGEFAFQNCEYIPEADMPSVDTIGKSAFENCKRLGDVTAPQLTTIGMYAFKNCKSLQYVNLPSAICIGEYAFSYCDNLHDVILTSAKEIGKDAFTGSKHINKMSFSDCLEKIGKNAFKDTKFFGYNGTELPKDVQVLRGHTFMGNYDGRLSVV